MPAPIIGGGLGLIGSLIGGNQQAQASQQAAQASDQAAAGENALIQQAILPAYQQMLQTYQQQYAPLTHQLTSGASQLFPSLGGMGQAFNNNQAFTSPGNTQAFTGIPMQNILQSALQYFTHPGNTLSGLGGVGGQALAGELSPGQTGAVGPQALSYFLNQATTGGIDPKLIGQALQQNDASGAQMTSNIRNQLGASLPNLSGTLRDQSFNQLGSDSNLLATLTGQSQQLRDQAMQNAFGTAQGMDQQTLSRLAQAMTTAGGIDSQTANMLQTAFGLGTQGQQTSLGNLTTGQNQFMNLLQSLAGITNQGSNLLPGAAGGIQSIAQMYQNQGQFAANNAASFDNGATNPFSSLGNFFANNPAIFKGGGGSAPLPGVNGGNMVVTPPGGFASIMGI